MMINLENKIKELIEAYHGETTVLNDEIRAICDRWAALAQKNKVDPHSFRNSIIEDINKARKSNTDVSMVYNHKLKVLVENAKEWVLDGIGNIDAKSADHAMRVSNALQFLSIEMDTLTDDSAFMILKGFLNDYEQLRLFKSVIEKKRDFVDASGVTLFPNTFGKLLEHEGTLSAINEIESIAGNLFLHEKGEAEGVPYGNTYISLYADGYDEMCQQSLIVELAKKLNALCGVAEQVED